MTNSKPIETAFADLLCSLESVRTALVSGDFTDLNEHAQTQDHLIRDLVAAANRTPLSATDMRVLRSAATRNQRLLAAARQGVDAVRQRQRDIVETRLNAQTYDSSGRKQRLSPEAAGLEKRS